MRFPSINKQGKRRVNIPQFTGGINLRDNPTQCNDNQLTELVNMWFKDGTLRTRPGLIRLNDNEVFETESPSLTGEYSVEGKAHNILNDDKRLISIKETRISTIGEALKTSFYAIHFFWCNKDGAVKLPSIRYDYQENNFVNKDLENYFVVNQNGTLYCFVKTSADRSVYMLEKSKEKWQKLGDEDMYIPTVMTHCKVNHKLKDGHAYEKGHTGTMLEGYNLLSNYYKMVYSTVNTDADISDDAYPMVYSVEESTYYNKYKGYEVKAEYIDKKGNVHKHSVTLQGVLENGWFVWEKEASTDGLVMGVCSRQIRFAKPGVDSAATLTRADYVEDNLTITVPFIPDNREEELDKIFCMTECEWFGGSSAGLTGGTRLFLGSNKKHEEKALVIWSGLNKPLYFPENSYFYVGDTSQRITGFGKQSNMLVIFKENETWYTQYHQNTSITGEDLASQRVIDLQASAVYFPLVQINSSIGCSYPGTIQLCRNRLVWLGSGNKVYSLVSNNQYNERSVYVVSEMIERRFKKENLSKSIAYDWNGYYCLKCGGEMFLMDYNSYGYIYVSSHSKTEDANIRIPWYYWEFPNAEDEGTADIMFLCGDELLNMKFKASGSDITCSAFEFRSGIGNDILVDGTKKEIKSLIETKFFDFGEPNFYKNIGSVALSLGYNGGGEISVAFITDGGEEQTGLVLEEAADERSAGFTKSKILTPAICSALRFGIRLESQSDILIDGLTIDYRVTGRAR